MSISVTIYYNRIYIFIRKKCPFFLKLTFLDINRLIIQQNLTQILKLGFGENSLIFYLIFYFIKVSKNIKKCLKALFLSKIQNMHFQSDRMRSLSPQIFLN